MSIERITASGDAESRRPGTPLRVVHSTAQPDLVAAERAAFTFLMALGVELDPESLAATPGRMARAYAEMFTPRPFDLTTFPNEAGYDELIIARSIPVQSVCEHHLLPFVGVAHVGYLPGDRILGLSKLARVVELFARRPQVQERLTQQVADWLQDNVSPRGVAVVVEAEHLCMSLRGVRAPDTSTVTSALHGHLRDDASARAEFFSLLHRHRKD
ncbi:MAG: cyclohydrolase [Friedmanniella sp.]|nr:cyclohydrolase [Friedmanniella sp.]